MIYLNSIQHAYQNLRFAWNEHTHAVSRLSSGKRIQTAADDPSGLAISVRFHTQIRGNQQAQRNILDAVSLAQTAEAGLQSIQEQLLRIRELLVLVQNGTLSENDRLHAQQEIDQLIESIDSIGKGTTFNGISLLSSWIEGTPASPGTPGTPPRTEIIVRQSPTFQTSFDLNPNSDQFVVPNYNIPVRAADGNFTITAAFTPMWGKGPDNGPDLHVISPIGEKFGLNDGGYFSNGKAGTVSSASASSVTFNGEKSNPETMTFISPITGDWQVRLVNPEKKKAYRIELTIAYQYTETVTIPGTPGTPPVPGTPGSTGKVTIQTGSTTGDALPLELSYVTAEALGIRNLIATDPNAIGKIDQAMNTVSSERTKYGIYQNRLQHRYDVLDTLNLNHASSVSRIEDADMAAEMITLVRGKLLHDVGTKVLVKELDTYRDRIAALLTFAKNPIDSNQLS
ncbi:flagellin [Effusibacillus consociatus]|uniref:Flagellin n=1 Tax=Effusibacillus consociatus TaxID=1117041 RepID=A0ABV9PW84_9BACL